jgi:hypothetical protein
MDLENQNPGALAGAHRADVTMLAGKDDTCEDTPRPLDLQVRSLLARYAVSLPLAVAVAELAFASGRAK